MSKFAKLILISSLLLGVLFSFFVFSWRDEVEVASPGLPSGGLLNENLGAYQVGYEVGYRAFLMQMGRNVEPVVRYTVLEDLQAPEDREEMDRGYVDGYHRAADSFSCPR